MALVVLAVFWIAVAVFLLLAPDHLFKTPDPRMRRIGAAGCVVFATFCLIGLAAL
jgi:hypothetical protein